MIEFYLFRHAQSVANTQSEFISGRSDDTPLTEPGKEQAKRLGQRLLKEKLSFDQIYSSPSVRAYQTATIVCKQMGIAIEKIVKEKALVELGQGEWVGKKRSAIYTPQTKTKINLDPWNFKAPEGESQKEVEERMLQFSQRFLNQQNLSIAIFGHGVATRCWLRGILEFNPERTWKMGIDNTAITHVKYDSDGWHIMKINDSAHLLFNF